MNLTELRAAFADPPNEYRMMPLFRINDDLSQEEIRWQVRQLREKGFGGVFSTCERFEDGAPAPFLSEWWWRAVRWLAEACAAEGLHLWVYDEEDWPSGSAGGQLTEKHPEFRWKYLRPDEHRFRGPAVARLELGPDLFVAATAHRTEGGRVLAESIVDLSGTVRDGRLEWAVPEGNWTVTLYSAPPGKGFFLESYGDLMDREAMRTFIEWVYEEHHRRLRDVPGLRLVGYFTDEPACSYSMIEWGERFHWYPAMPFTPALPEAFRARHGYDWRSHLPLLYHDAGPQSLRFRCHHWETCCHLYSENYFRQIHDFCEARGLLSSGHLVVEENFANHLAQQAGNLMTHFRHMHVPGIDWIHPFESALPATTPKYATSIAHLRGRPRTWCESFAASGWGLTFQEMRGIVNWEHVNGINMQVPICYKCSLRGPKRARFYNPGISYQQPHWEHFRGFADCEARLCLLTAGGGHVAQVALVYPEVDLWAHCWEPKLLTERSDEFNALGDGLRARGYDFDILDDRAILEESRIGRGAIETATERFPVLVVPRVDAVRRALLARLIDLVQAGGTVLLLGSLPRHSMEAGSDDPAVGELLEGLLGSDGLRLAREGRRTWGPRGAGWAGFAPDIDALVTMIRSAVAPDVVVEPADGPLFAYHRRVGESDLYLLFNRSDERRLCEVTLSVPGHPERWDPVSGEIAPASQYEITERGTRLRLEFQPQELIPVFIHPRPLEALLPPEWETVAEIPVPGPFRFRAEETLRRPHIGWNFEGEEAWTSTAPPLEIPDTLPLGDWCRLGLAHFSGLGTYTCDVSIDDLAEGSRVVLDLGKVALSARVTVNGAEAGLVFFEPYRLDITAHVRSGVNRLEIEVANSLSNHYAQFKELEGAPLNAGGDHPERRQSGLLGPVVLRVQSRRG